MRISIAIPVYNCEQYITRCIDSILSQDYPKEKIEIIVVDDGSTDKSGALVDAYANIHDNIRVFHQPNQGVSVACNTALEHVTGDYIQFLDSDDFTCLSMWHHEYLGFRFNAISMAFAMIVLLLTMKVQVHNPVLEWCGKHLFPIYMYMRLPMIVIENTWHNSMLNAPALFIGISLMVTLVIAYFYRYWQIRLT